MRPWWWNNLITTPQRWAAYWLRRRGWVVFYLDEACRPCRAVCWMEEYARTEGPLGGVAPVARKHHERLSERAAVSRETE